MLRTSTFWKICSLCLLAQVSLAHARQTTSPPSSAPPGLERIDESSETPITVTAKPSSDKKITEKREQGKVTEVKVTSGKSNYVLKPNTPAGSALPGDAQSSAIRAPQWQVMEFNLGAKQKKDKDDEPASTTPPAPTK